MSRRVNSANLVAGLLIVGVVALAVPAVFLKFIFSAIVVTAVGLIIYHLLRNSGTDSTPSNPHQPRDLSYKTDRGSGGDQQLLAKPRIKAQDHLDTARSLLDRFFKMGEHVVRDKMEHNFKQELRECIKIAKDQGQKEMVYEACKLAHSSGRIWNDRDKQFFDEHCRGFGFRFTNEGGDCHGAPLISPPPPPSSDGGNHFYDGDMRDSYARFRERGKDEGRFGSFPSHDEYGDEAEMPDETDPAN